MTTSQLLLTSTSILATLATYTSAASSAMTLRNLENTNLFLDGNGVALDAGDPNTTNGNGTLAQLGFFSSSTASFSGEWNVVSEFHIGDFYLQSGSTAVDDGKFLARVSYDESSLGLPSSDTQMAIRFYDGTDAGTSNYNTVTHVAWTFLSPTDPAPSDRDFNVNDNTGTLAWEAGGTDAFKTTIVAVPEPSSFALLGLSALTLAFRRKK